MNSYNYIIVIFFFFKNDIYKIVIIFFLKNDITQTYYVIYNIILFETI